MGIWNIVEHTPQHTFGNVSALVDLSKETPTSGGGSRTTGFSSSWWWWRRRCGGTWGRTGRCRCFRGRTSASVYLSCYLLGVTSLNMS